MTTLSSDSKNVINANNEISKAIETSLKKSTNKVEKKEVVKKDLKKEATTTKANEYLLSMLDKSLFVSNSGMSKENIYKASIFATCITDRDKKTIRRKIRNNMDSFISSFISYETNKNTDKIKKLLTAFKDFYTNVYSLNDYSLNSLISANTDTVKKDNVIKMLSIIKKYDK